MSDTQKKENEFSCCEDSKKMENCCDKDSGKFDCKTMVKNCCGDASGKFDCKTMMEKMCNC